MSRRKLLRRFDPQYGVSEIMIAEEAKRLAREIDHREAVAPSRVEEWLRKSNASCRSCWDELQMLITPLPERDRWIIRSLLFRDLHHILALYLHHLRAKYPNPSSPSPPLPTRENKPQSAFSEWLFDP